MLLFGTLFWHTGAGIPTPPAPAVEAPRARGTAPFLWPLDGRDEKEVRRARQRFGVIPPDVEALIEEVATRQALSQEQDEQKRFDELYRELELRSIEFDARYLEALSAMRKELLSQTREELLAKQARLRKENDEILMLLLIAAAAVS